MFGANAPVGHQAVALINAHEGTDLVAACQKCAGDRVATARAALVAERDTVMSALEANLMLLPIVSLQNPQGWYYKSIGIVTAQSTTGTGMFSDVASAFTDVFGAQSNAYNNKLRAGENICKASLRMQALEQNGNAILAADVDYSEVGGQRAMLMVCMTGTVVEVTNVSIFGDEMESKLETLRVRFERLKVLNSINLSPTETHW